MKRVVITGAGTVNALGQNVPDTMAAMREGRCGIGTLDIADLDRLAIKIGGHCRTCNPHFDYDTQAQIEELHFQSRGEWIALNK